jgi:ketosteroid isomerase-like protein
MKNSLNSIAFTLLTMFLAGCACPMQKCSLSSEQTAVMAPVHQFVDGFNAGDSARAIAECANPIVIIDDFPPHLWQGNDAAQKWLHDYEADAKSRNLTPLKVTLHAPRHVEVKGDRAYVVAPTDYAYKLDGKTIEESGCTLTATLQKGSSGWKIDAWSWSKR